MYPLLRERGATQPELSKLIELSKLYHVSVDELLSLEHAKNAPDTQDAAPAAETPPCGEDASAAKPDFRSFCAQHRLLTGGTAAALVILIAVGMHYNSRINALSTQVNDLRNQLYTVQSNLSSQIDGISNNVSDILARESSLISQYDYEITNVDLKKQECTIAFSLLPKTISEGTTVIIGVTDHGNSSPLDSYRPGYSADLTQDGFGYLHGSVTVPLSDELGVGVNFKRDGETQSEELDTIYGIKSQNSPSLYTFLSLSSYTKRSGSPWVYRLALDSKTSFASFTLGAFNGYSIQSAHLEFTRGDGLLEIVPLSAALWDGTGTPPQLGSGDNAVSSATPAVHEGCAEYFFSCASADGEPLELSIPLTDSPLVCEMVVELSNHVTLRARLLQVQAIAGGENYEETNYIDLNGMMLPFTVD